METEEEYRKRIQNAINEWHERYGKLKKKEIVLSSKTTSNKTLCQMGIEESEII